MFIRKFQEESCPGKFLQISKTRRFGRTNFPGAREFRHAFQAGKPPTSPDPCNQFVSVTGWL